MDGIDLSTKMTDAETLVSWMQLYNVCVRHPFLKVGVPVSSAQREHFFTGMCYNIANQILNLDDIEHGIIRSNIRHPYHFKAQFVGGDPRHAWAVSKLNPRIDFTLFCGAKSFPPINFYTVENLEQELQLVTESFCLDEANVIVDDGSNTLYLSMLFKRDNHSRLEKVTNIIGNQSSSCSGVFRGNGGLSLAKMVTGSIGSGGINVKFLPYDSASSAAPGNCIYFHYGLLRTMEKCLRAPISKNRASFKGGGCFSVSKIAGEE